MRGERRTLSPSSSSPVAPTTSQPAPIFPKQAIPIGAALRRVFSKGYGPADVRADVFEFLAKNNFKFVPSVSNKFMVDVKRPGEEVIEAMRKQKVYIGRVWPSWPTYVRVSIGTQEEMNKFKTAFLAVMS